MVLKLALWCYVLYRSFNKLKKVRLDSFEQVEGLMVSYLRDGVAGHSGAVTFLNNIHNPLYIHYPARCTGRDDDSDEASGTGG